MWSDGAARDGDHDLGLADLAGVGEAVGVSTKPLHDPADRPAVAVPDPTRTVFPAAMSNQLMSAPGWSDMHALAVPAHREARDASAEEQPEGG